MENYQTENTQKKEEIRQNGKQEQLRQRELVRAFDEKLHSYVSNGMEPVEKLGKVFFLCLWRWLCFCHSTWKRPGCGLCSLDLEYGRSALH